jgi:hypothetical protein
MIAVITEETVIEDDLKRLWLLHARGDYIPKVGNIVMLVNHLGLFLIDEIDVEARTVDVTRLRSNVQLKGIPWSIIGYCDEGFLRSFAVQMRSILD